MSSEKRSSNKIYDYSVFLVCYPYNLTLRSYDVGSPHIRSEIGVPLYIIIMKVILIRNFLSNNIFLNLMLLPTKVTETPPARPRRQRKLYSLYRLKRGIINLFHTYTHTHTHARARTHARTH